MGKRKILPIYRWILIRPIYFNVNKLEIWQTITHLEYMMSMCTTNCSAQLRTILCAVDVVSILHAQDVLSAVIFWVIDKNKSIYFLHSISCRRQKFWTKLGNSDHSVSVHWESLSCSLVIGLTDKCLAVKSIRVQRNNSFSKADWAKTKTDGTLFSTRNWALLQKRNLYFQDLILPAQYSETEAIKKLKSCYIRASFIKPL